MNREELIERVASIIRGVYGEQVRDTYAVSRAICNQLEQAHTPTDDEKLERARQEAATQHLRADKAEARLRATPTDDEREALVREVSLAHSEAWSDERECAEAPDRIADAILAAGFRRTVQGEPTDAQVRAAWDALGPRRTVHLEYEDLRIALRAAAAARGA